MSLVVMVGGPNSGQTGNILNGPSETFEVEGADIGSTYEQVGYIAAGTGLRTVQITADFPVDVAFAPPAVAVNDFAANGIKPFVIRPPDGGGIGLPAMISARDYLVWAKTPAA